MIIIGTYRTLEIGKIYNNSRVSDTDCEYHNNVPLFIIAKATAEDYIEQCKSQGIDLRIIEKIEWDKVKFYKISMD